MSQNSRRDFLKKSGLLTLGAGLLSSASQAAEMCLSTPPQTQGPFYPGETRFTREQDLTISPVDGARRASGQVIYIKGTILDSQCKPIKNANVEIWQACESGKYNHPRDPNPAPLDPHFRYWAEAFSDVDGSYWFKSILPGAYPASSVWTRPPHIHFRIAALGYRELVTQMYFEGQNLNDRDLILQDLSQEEQDSVIVEMSPVGPELEPGALIGEFDITLSRVR